MEVKQRTVPVGEFARAMIEADQGFAQRVRRFEEAHGSVEADTLGVLAQAYYFCRFNAEYEGNLSALCRAIAAERPMPFYCHCQVTPARWNDLHTYVVAVRHWLGAELPLPAQVDPGRVERIGRQLGRRTPAKEALAELFLSNLIEHLSGICLSRVADRPGQAGASYTDFTDWYSRPDGGVYGDGSSDDYIDRCKDRAREHMASGADSAKQLIDRITAPSQPPCMHRFGRYMEIQIASIGALRWRGRLPREGGQKAHWQEFWDEVDAGLEGWLQGSPPATPLAERIQRNLGEPTERSKAVVHGFFLAPPEESGFNAWRWLNEKGQEESAVAAAAFPGWRPRR
ncbi:MAG: hypothetical protein ACYS1C_08695 [Planctomycetota bacterium]|jgi:hypothetical protein